MRPFRRSVLLAVILVLLACRGEADGEVQRQLGAGISSRPLEDSAALPLEHGLKVARDLLEHRIPSDVRPLTKAVPRLFLTVHRRQKPRVTVTGLQHNFLSTLEDLVTQARAKLEPGEVVRLQLDVVVRAQADPTALDRQPARERVGLEGLFVPGEQGAVGFLLPHELAWEPLYTAGNGGGYAREIVRGRLAARALLPTSDLRGRALFVFETRALVEGAEGSPPVSLLRGMVFEPPAVHPESLRAAAREGAEYLVRALDERGRFRYNYRAVRDVDGTAYNLLRHCGAVYALLEAYEVWREPTWLEGAERALEYALARTRPRPDWVRTRPEWQDFLHVLDEDREELSKLGAAGLLLIALSKHAVLVGSTRTLPVMKRLASFIAQMQDEQGRFRSYFQVEPGQKIPEKDVLYYPGEAMLGLLRLNALSPDPALLEQVVRGARYLREVRDRDKPDRRLEHDHWLTMTLLELYALTRDEAVAVHARRIGRAIQAAQNRGDTVESPDGVGGFFKLPGSTPASVRLEAYVALLELAHLRGESDPDLRADAVAVAGFVMRQQLTPANAFFLPNPEKAWGGVREGLMIQDVRIDYVQHAISGWLGLARELARGGVGEAFSDAARQAPSRTDGQ